MKKCSKCEFDLDERRFNKNKKYKDGLYPHCKACHSKQVSERKSEKECIACSNVFFGNGRKCCVCRTKKVNKCECGILIHKNSKVCLECFRKNNVKESNPAWRGGITKRHGYTHIYAPDHPNRNKAYVPEHHLVMEKHIGRYLNKGETVHHKNGIRSDNRIENLELWGSNHPPGQRILDLILWAESILEQYGHEKERLKELE